MRTKRKNYLPQCPPYPPGPPYQPYWQYPPCQESAAIPKALQSLPIPNRIAGTLFKQAQMMPKEHFPSLFGNMKGMAFGDWSVGSVQLQHRFTFQASLMLLHIRDNLAGKFTCDQKHIICITEGQSAVLTWKKDQPSEWQWGKKNWISRNVIVNCDQ